MFISNNRYTDDRRMPVLHRRRVFIQKGRIERRPGDPLSFTAAVKKGRNRVNRAEPMRP